MTTEIIAWAVLGGVVAAILILHLRDLIRRRKMTPDERRAEDEEIDNDPWSQQR